MVDIIAKYMAGLSIRSEKTRGLVLDESNLHQFDPPTSNTVDRPLPNLPQESRESRDNSELDPKIHGNRHSPTEILFQECINSDMLLDNSPRASTSTGASDTARLSPQPPPTKFSSGILGPGSWTADDELGAELDRLLLLEVEGALSEGFGVGNLPRGYVAQALRLAMLSDRGNVMHMLLEHGAAPEFQVFYGIWATQWAVMANEEDAMNALLSAKADPNRVSVRQESLLHMAAERGTDGILRSLISAGAAVDARNEDQRTPLHCATRRKGNVVILRELIQAYAEINATDLYGNTPLHFATRFGDVEMIQTLLLSGADPNSGNNLQQTPMFNILDSGRDAEIAALLLEYGADVNFRGMNGSTPLHLATRAERDDIVMMLLESGADISSQDHFAQTPLYLATERVNSAIITLLLERGADTAELDSTKRATPRIQANTDGNGRARQYGGTRSHLQSISEELDVEDEPMGDDWPLEDIEAADYLYVLYKEEL
jgi:ankyrin repeat protein